ncbi:MAG TPA: hypothetical protein VGE52_01890 [Pirellulales bacterium]
MSNSLNIVPSDNEVICVKCSQTRKTCCQVAEIYVSPGDRKRIADYTGRDDFWSFQYPGNPKYLEGADEDPLWFACVPREDGTRAALHRRPDGDCTFLGPQGCVLPMETRPIVCRMYPYDYDINGIRPLLDVCYCPTHFLPPGRDMATELGMKIEDAVRWFEQLYEEIQTEPHARWPKQVVKAKTPASPPVQAEAKPAT